MHPNARKHLKAPCPTTPGEIITDGTNHAINTGRRTATLVVSNTADRPIPAGGSYYHFAETNAALGFDCAVAHGMQLNIASRTAVRFEPGQQRTVTLVDFGRRTKDPRFSRHDK